MKQPKLKSKMMKAVHNATINRATKNAARNEREQLFEQMKPLLAKLIEECSRKDAAIKEKRAIYTGLQYKALTIINAHNHRPGRVMSFKKSYFESLIAAFIIDHLLSKESHRQIAVNALLPLMPLKFRLKCRWRRLFK